MSAHLALVDTGMDTTIGELLADAEIFVDGDWIESKDQDPNGDVRLIQLADIGDGCYLNKSSRFLTHEKAQELRCTFLEPGDILVARMPDPLGRACIFPGDTKRAVTVVDVCIIRADEKKIDTRWLMHAINSPLTRQRISEYVSGTTRQRISRGNLAKIKISVPTLPEQRRIAAILDKADALRAKRREAIAKLDQLLQSVFLEMFGDPVSNPRGWPVVSLGKVCDVRDGTHDSPKYVESGYPLVTSKNLSSGRVDFEGAQLISPDDFEAINKRSKVDLGDLLMPMIGSIGNPVLVEHEPSYAIKNIALLKFNGFALINNKYALHLLRSDFFNWAAGKVSRGGTQKFLALKDIRGLQIPLPPIELQMVFSKWIDQIENQRAKLQTAQTGMGALFQSIQQAAFCGK